MKNKFSKYLDDNGLRRGWMADRLGITVRHLKNITDLGHRPSATLAKLIAIETHGDVTEADFE